MKKFKLVTLLGIRPDIIRMHKLISLLDDNQKQHNYEHIYAHTGQHFDYELDEVFYKQLNVRKPSINLKVGKTLQESGGSTSFVYQMGILFQKISQLIEEVKPDAIMYLGDTNSVLSSQVAARYQIPVIHIEAGGRSFDWRMPEEKCRIIIDHMSDMLYAYLPRYKENLLREGVSPYRIKVIGNIIDDAIKSFLPLAERTSILKELGLKKNKYALVTIHREENTEDRKIFSEKIADLIKLSKDLPIVFPLMPRVRKLLKDYGLQKKLDDSSIIQSKPLGFLEFLNLESNARLTITDSGTVQEESLILGVPCLVTRRSTERPETIQAGATIMSDENLYENALRTIQLKTNWDRTILNPYNTSPSEVVFADLMKKIQSGFFKSSRDFGAIKSNPFARDAYNK